MTANELKAYRNAYLQALRELQDAHTRTLNISVEHQNALRHERELRARKRAARVAYIAARDLFDAE